MKKFVNIILVVFILFVANGCEKYIDGWDESPNSPTSVTPGLLLSSSEVAVFATYEGQLARTATIWVQQLTGTDFQMTNVNTYFVLEGDNVNEWEVVYTDGLSSLNELINTFGDENPWYAGIAKTLKAMLMGIATDIWGDVPLREAALGLGGEEFFSPNFDPQQQVLQDIQDMLDDAIVDLNKPEGDNIELPGTDDFIFNGDVNQWLKVAYALKARYHNRLYGSDASGSATAALAAIQNADMTGPEDDANTAHGPVANTYNQWYAFQINRGNYIKMSDYFVTMLQEMNDPRLPFYAAPDDNGEYTGTPITSDEVSTSNIGTYIASQEAPAKLISYVEVKFIEAECEYRLGNMGPAADAHNAAVIASIEQVTGEAAPQDYIDANASEDASSITLEKIMMQKYIATFTQVETWTDWRRTGIPELTPNPNGTISGIPLRLPTPLDERLYNTNATVVSDKLEPVWWDQPYPAR
jgi:hypothetical protein